MRFNPLTTKRTVVALMLAGSFGAAHATNGYFSHGYGVKAKGMGGASVAMSDNAFAGANNPAAAAFAGKRWDLGVELFMPERSVERSGGQGNFAGISGDSDSRQNNFLIPEFGYNNILSDKLGINLTVYGNGGMNTNYKAGGFTCGEDGPVRNPLCGIGKLGVNLEQLIIAPSVAYKPSLNHALGISPLIVYQKFRAYGLQAFQGFFPNGSGGFTNVPVSSNSSKLTNRGDSESTGLGVRLGYMGKLNDKVTFGASHAPKINMSKFNKYKGLFAEGGDFDIPENYTIGLAIQATPTLLVAVDHQRINYANVDSIGNPSTNQTQLGSKDGPGFGWKNIGVWKLGVQWQANQTWTLRAGYNRGDNPIRSRDVTFNILAPGVIKEHYTLGATMNLDKQSEMSFFYMHAKNNSVKGDSLFPAFLGAPAGSAGVEKIQMHQNSLGIQYSRRF